MDEELKGRIEEVNRLAEEIKDEARQMGLDSARFRLFCAYSGGQYDAWATVRDVTNELRRQPAKDEEDAKPDDPD